jgi:hypothetical protein
MKSISDFTDASQLRQLMANAKKQGRSDIIGKDSPDYASCRGPIRAILFTVIFLKYLLLMKNY